MGLSLVRQLVDTQFPQWKDLPLTLVESRRGMNSAICRLGQDMVVRLPRLKDIADTVDKEHWWLSKFASFLPLTIPVPIVKGLPTEDYPWHWSVFPWIHGEPDAATDYYQVATMLGQFIAALQRIDTTGELLGDVRKEHRSLELVADESVRAAIHSLQDVLDTTAVTTVWEDALQTPVWSGSTPVWQHGDLHSRNLLFEQGKLTAVIDFNSLGLGDPAIDLVVSWHLLPSEMRNVFRAAVSVGDETWVRARSHVLSFALMALAYHLNRNTLIADQARQTINDILYDYYS